MNETYELIVKNGEYDKAFETLFTGLTAGTINVHNFKVRHEDTYFDEPDDFFQECSFDNQEKYITWLIENEAPLVSDEGGLPVGMEIASWSSVFHDYVRALDFDHLTSEGYEELETSITENWGKTDMELYAIVYFNGDVYQLSELEFPPDSLLDKIDEDEEAYETLIEIFKNERDQYAKKMNKEIADEAYNEFIEAIGEEEEEEEE